MTAKDKDYVDSLNSLANKRMDGIENRIAIIENQNGVPAVPTEAQSVPAPIPTITLDDLREMITTEITLCLKQHQEQILAEEVSRKQNQAKEYSLEIAKKRKDYEAAGRIFNATPTEWLELIHQTQNTHYENTNEKFKILATIGETFYRSLIELQKTSDNILELVTPPPPPPITPEPVSIFANLPSGLHAKIKELRKRIQDRLHTYLQGSYSLHRGYTLLIVILYGLLLAMFAMFRISVSG